MWGQGGSGGSDGWDDWGDWGWGDWGDWPPSSSPAASSAPAKGEGKNKWLRGKGAYKKRQENMKPKAGICCSWV